MSASVNPRERVGDPVADQARLALPRALDVGVREVRAEGFVAEDRLVSRLPLGVEEAHRVLRVPLPVLPEELRRAARIGAKLADPCTADGLGILVGLQRDDGCWHKGPSWWRKPGSPGSNIEVVDWGGRGPSEMTTLNALLILKAAGRLVE